MFDYSCNQIYILSKSCITSAKPFQSQNLTSHHSLSLWQPELVVKIYLKITTWTTSQNTPSYPEVWHCIYRQY